MRTQWFKLRNTLGLSNDDVPIGLKAFSNNKKNLSQDFLSPKLQIKNPPIDDKKSDIGIQIIKQKSWNPAKPLVSVIVPCFNYGDYIEEAIDSVLNQTFQDFEIIVVDDGSTDPHTIKILHNLNKPKTKVIHQKNQKLPNARNNGIKISKGKYICCLDADDLIKPTYLEKCLIKLETENLDICYTWLQEFGDSDQVWPTDDFDLSTLVERNCVEVSAVFSRSIWQKTGGYDSTMIDGYEDWNFWIAIAKAGGVGKKIDEPLFLYRKHGRSMIDDAIEKHQLLYQKIQNNHQELYQNLQKISDMKNSRLQYCVEKGYRNLLQNINQQKSDTKSILFVLPFTVLGGVDTVTLNLIKYFRKYEFEINVITTLSPLLEQEDCTVKYEKIITGIYHLPKLLPEYQWKECIFYLIESKQVDFIFLAGSSFFYTILAEVKQNFPKIKIIDQLYNEYGHLENNRKFADYIDFNIVENETVESCLLLTHKEQPAKVRLIKNGIDINYFDSNTIRLIDINSLKKNALIPDSSFIISFIGRFSPEKCPEFFLGIANYLKNERNIYFVLAGNGVMEEQLKSYITNEKLSGHIHCPGIVDPKIYLAISNLVILPSKIDGRPNIVLESLSMGVPVVASSVGGLPEIIKDSYNGFLCKPGDIDDFVNRIKQILKDEELYLSMKKNAREYAVNSLDIKIMYQSYLDTLSIISNT